MPRRIYWALPMLLCLCLACGGESPDAPPSAPSPQAEALSEPEPCRVVFSPDEELEEATAQAAARWAAPTGCDIGIGDDGYPVFTVESIAAPDAPPGYIAGGGVYRYPDGGCAQIGMVEGHGSAENIAHEIGHCLGGPGHLDDPNSLMHGMGKGRVLDRSSLEKICASFPCLAFVPEP